MSQTIQRQKYDRKSAFDALLKNPYDEEAWRELFGSNLDVKVCYVIIKEYGVITITTWKKGCRQEITCTRESIAYC